MERCVVVKKRIVNTLPLLEKSNCLSVGTMIKLINPSKLHSLGWKHTVELEDGIKTMYEWYLVH